MEEVYIIWGQRRPVSYPGSPGWICICTVPGAYLFGRALICAINKKRLIVTFTANGKRQIKVENFSE